MLSQTTTSSSVLHVFTLTAVIVREILAEICAKESHSLEEIRKGVSHYKYCAFGCCKTDTSDDPCCPIIGPVSGIIISILGIIGIGCLCYCFCGKRNQNTDHFVIESNRKSSTYSTVLRDDVSCYPLAESHHVNSHHHNHAVK